ncbi:MAG: four helix bundle protein [bacterium]|nr:four helix bundle protein [bacterium]
MGFKRFEDIEAWKDARILAKMIREICKNECARRDFSWIDQIKRSALSIMANIAEGFEAQSDLEFANFAGYAKRSSAEVRSHLYYGLDAGYLSMQELESAMDLSRKISGSLTNLIKYLRISHRKVRAQTRT